jgi:hypothetical protein
MKKFIRMLLFVNMDEPSVEYKKLYLKGRFGVCFLEAMLLGMLTNGIHHDELRTLRL